MPTPPIHPNAAKEMEFEWTGKDRHGKRLRGRLLANGQVQALATLRRQGVFVSQIKKRRRRMSQGIKPKDVALFTRQMATMMKAGVPLLQAFDMVGHSHVKPHMARLLHSIRQDVETGTALNVAFRKHPAYFDTLYCNVIAAAETAGVLDTLLERLATHLEKIETLKRKLQSAMVYPLFVFATAFVVIAVIMMWVIPAFKEVFQAFGADLPLLTQWMIRLSDFFVQHGWLLLGTCAAGLFALRQLLLRSSKFRHRWDRWLLKLPIFGALLSKSCIARWARTLSTMFAAGVPLVEALDCVAGVAGNTVYREATIRIQNEVTTGTGLASAVANTHTFPSLVVQMCAIGEEAGAVDHMLAKAAEFYEQEVDDMVAGLSSLMEPIIIVLLGGMIGAIVVAMYLPVFKMGQVF